MANTEGEGVSNVVALAVQCEFDGDSVSDGDFLLALSFTNQFSPESPKEGKNQTKRCSQCGCPLAVQCQFDGVGDF